MRISLALAIALLVAACANFDAVECGKLPGECDVDAVQCAKFPGGCHGDACAADCDTYNSDADGRGGDTCADRDTSADSDTIADGVPEPTAAPTPTPAPWASYKSKRYRYVIKYPATWVVTPGKAGLADQFDGYRYPYFFVNRSTVPGIASVSLTVARDKAYYKSHYKGKVVSNRPVKLHGYSGRLVTYRGVSDGVKLLFQIVLAKGHVFYPPGRVGLSRRRRSGPRPVQQVLPGSRRPT